MIQSDPSPPPLTFVEPSKVAPRGTLVVIPGRGEQPEVYRRFGTRISLDAYRVHVLQDPILDEHRVRRQVTASITAAVDLGATKVACFIMKPDGVRPADRTLTAAGVGYVQSRGVRGGAVVEVDEASGAIAMAVERAEALAQVKVSGVTV